MNIVSPGLYSHSSLLVVTSIVNWNIQIKVATKTITAAVQYRYIKTAITMASASSTQTNGRISETQTKG